MTARPSIDPKLTIESLSRAHYNAIHDWTRRRFADPRDADEVVSETLVRAWRGYHTFDPSRGSERAWLFGIARNVAADHHRQSTRHLSLVVGDRDEEQGSVDPSIERLGEVSQVKDALDRLSDEHRTVIVESFFNGRSAREIASMHGLALGTVKSRLFYGLKAVRSALEEEGVLR